MVSEGVLTASLGGLSLFLPLLPGHPCGSAGVCGWGRGGGEGEVGVKYCACLGEISLVN